MVAITPAARTTCCLRTLKSPSKTKGLQARTRALATVRATWTPVMQTRLSPLAPPAVAAISPQQPCPLLHCCALGALLSAVVPPLLRRSSRSQC